MTAPSRATNWEQDDDFAARSHAWQPPQPRTELLWAGIDLDGTLAEGVWTPSSSGREIGAPIERNVRKLEALRSAGFKIIIHTSRGYEHFEAIEAWLEFHRIPYSRIVCGKLLAAIYVDDRAVESEVSSWLPELQAERQYHYREHPHWVPESIEF